MTLNADHLTQVVMRTDLSHRITLGDYRDRSMLSELNDLLSDYVANVLLKQGATGITVGGEVNDQNFVSLQSNAYQRNGVAKHTADEIGRRELNAAKAAFQEVLGIGRE